MNSNNRVRNWRKNTKDKMIAAMGGKCQCCGYNTCSSSLAFHHIDPSIKDLSFGKIRANPKSWEKIVNELKKCILVCHNCHSEIHAGIRTLPKFYETFNDYYSNIENVIEYDDCPICHSQKSISRKFCSQLCAQKNKRKVDWGKIDLLQLLKSYKISEIEKMLGVSNAAIYKRRDKILENKKGYL